MSKVLVTGGAGYIGSHTCVELINNGYDIIIVDNFTNSSMESIHRIEKITGSVIEFYNCDIRNKKELRKIFLDNEIESVIHFAGLKAVGESCQIPLEYYNNNVYGTIVLCEVMDEFNVKKLIFSSSATVYGDNTAPYNENMKNGLITNPYGFTKAMIEQILTDLCKADNAWNVIILRYFNPIGAHESGLIGENPKGIPNNIMPYMLKVAIGKLPRLVVFGDNYDTKDGTCIRDYVHVVDLARGHVCALKKLFEIKGVDIYNLGTGKGCSVLELITKFEEASGKKLNYVIGDRRVGDLPICFAETLKAENELNWKAEYDITRMCKDSWNWQIKNPNGYSSTDTDE